MKERARKKDIKRKRTQSDLDIERGNNREIQREIKRARETERRLQTERQSERAIVKES